MPIKETLSALAFASAVLFGVSSAQAVPISQFDQQLLTTNGQLFNFLFTPLPASDGAGGQLFITLSGDYAPRPAPPPLSKGATITLDVSGGILELYNDNSGGDGVATNTIPGLTLANSSTSGGGGQTFVFIIIYNMAPTLLDSILADGDLSMTIQNTGDISPVGVNNFVEVGIKYNSAAIPEPGGLTLFGLGLVGLGFARRRKKA